MGRLLRVLLAVFLVLVLVVAGALVAAIGGPYPDVDGEVVLEGLTAPVEVVRDELGIPHVYASTTADLVFAEGYVHAQDRFWQMDAWRAVSGGRLAERFGDDQLPADRFLRTLGWHVVAAAEYELLEPDDRALLDAYTAGVNAWLAGTGTFSRSLEHTLVRVLSGYEPEPWTGVDSLAFLKVLAWDLRSNLDEEIERATLDQAVGAEVTDTLFPPYRPGAPWILRDDEWQVPTDLAARLPAPAAAALAPLLEDVAAQVALVDAALGRPDGVDLGSNSWVLAGSRTASGAPLLANDPHLSIQMPSIWYAVGLHCTTIGPECDREVAGVSVAGVPGVVIGHNHRIAWGLTNLAPDVMDLFVEQLDPSDPARYLTEDGPVAFETREEVLRSGGADAEDLAVRLTRHGPVISDVYGDLDAVDPAVAAGEEPGSGDYVIALAWTALEPGTTFAALQDVNRATDFDAFRAAAAQFDVPSQNLVYADVDGTIGYVAPGRIPIRASGDGRRPVPGWTGASDWVGEVPRDALPFVRDPGRGFVVTANNAVVDPEGAGRLLTADWTEYGYRATRIEQLVEQAEAPLDSAAVQAMQGDTLDLSTEWLLPAVAALDVDGDAARAQELLAGWDRRLAPDSIGAGVYQAFWRSLLARAFHDDLPEPQWPAGGSRWFEVVRLLLDQPAHALWDDQGTDTVELAPDTTAAALEDTLPLLREEAGDDEAGWRWGALHTATFENQTLGQSGIGPVEALFNRGPYETGGGRSIVNATANDPREGFAVTALPSMRLLVDLADFDATRLILTTGQSGHAFARHYVDQAQRWADGELAPLPWTRPAVDAAAADVLVLLPG